MARKNKVTRTRTSIAPYIEGSNAIKFSNEPVEPILIQMGPLSSGGQAPTHDGARFNESSLDSLAAVTGLVVKKLRSDFSFSSLSYEATESPSTKEIVLTFLVAAGVVAVFAIGLLVG